MRRTTIISIVLCLSVLCLVAIDLVNSAYVNKRIDDLYEKITIEQWDRDNPPKLQIGDYVYSRDVYSKIGNFEGYVIANDEIEIGEKHYVPRIRRNITVKNKDGKTKTDPEWVWEKTEIIK